MVVPSERSRKGGGAAAARRRRILTFVLGLLVGAIAATCTSSMWRLSLATNTAPQLESEASSLTSSSTTSQQKGTTTTTISTGGGRLPDKDNWIHQSQLTKKKQPAPSSNSSTTILGEKHPPMPKALAKQLAAIHERHQINRPKNPQEETTKTAKEDDAEHQQPAGEAVAVRDDVRYDTSAHDMVDLENDQLHRDSRIGDMLQALGNAGNSNSNKQGAPATPLQLTPVVAKTTTGTDETPADQNRAVEEQTLKVETTKEITTSHTKVETTTSDVVAMPEVQDFVKQPGVVIGVKIHGSGHVIQLKQSLCLLKAAYNDRLNYDIMIFVTEALSDNEVRDIKEVVHPAHVIVETDKDTLSKQISKLTRDQKQDLLNRCSKNSTEELFWWTRCCDEDNKGDCMPLAYNWQAEFRSKWIWYSKGLAKYKWMMWYDSDAMATKVWQQDPVAFAIRHQLKMLFDHFPQGFRSHEDLRGMMEDAYNGDHICDVKLVNGHLQAFRKVGGCNKPKIPQIHGFFHITDLDFYRSEANLKWFNNMIGDRKFTRTWDDQLAVTVPAAILAPNKSWDMNANGIVLDVYHNQHFDGDIKRRHRGGGYVHWWENNSNTSFPEAIEECAVFVKNSGR